MQAGTVDEIKIVEIKVWEVHQAKKVIRIEFAIPLNRFEQ